MDINKENIKLIIFEYLEGNLSQKDIHSLFVFVENNPFYKELFDSLSKTKLIPDHNIRFDKKNILKKSEENIDIENFELLCIKYIEHNINENELKELFDQISKSDEKKKIFDIYQKTILTSEQKIKLENKNLLKKVDSEFEYKCIEYIEGELYNSTSVKFLSEISKDPNKKNTFERYEKTKLEPDLTITYNNKEKLKKTNVMISLRWIWSAAASVIIIIYLAFATSNTNKITLNNSQIAETNYINPINHKAVYKNKTTIKQQKSIATKHKIRNMEIKSVEAIHNNDLAEEYNKKDSIVNIEKPLIINDDIQYAQNQILLEDDSITHVVLEKLFSQNKFNYFHQMIEKVNNEKQTYLPNHKGSWWNVLENGTNFISEHTGTKVAIKEYKYEDNKRVKQEFSLGNFSFSRSISKK